MGRDTRTLASLLDAKLNPPAPGPAQLPRQHLLDAFAGDPSRRLVLVRAPAGFGKTSAMLQYRTLLERRGCRTAWLTLDPADNDIRRFLQCLTRAVDAILQEPEQAEDASAMLQHVDRLRVHDGPFALFLDDYEVIREAGVQGLVREIIDSLPRGGQVVIGSRSAPNLGLGRLRARAQLVEIDADQLRFSLDETREYLVERRGIALTITDIERLYSKTEGWVAGLWLASAALSRRAAPADFVDRFSGSSQEVADYLAEDVLNSQPPEARSFLLHTSVLRTLSPDLCRALVPAVDCDELLRRLATDNVLLTRIEGEERSYRYHSLFGAFLRTQLNREEPQHFAMLHLAASKWYETEHRPVPAIEHALDAGNTSRAVSLLRQHGLALLKAGRMRLLMRWFDALFDQDLAGHAELRMLQAWSLCFTRGPRDAMDVVQRFGLGSSDDVAVRPHLLALQPVLLSLMDRPEEAYECAMASVPHMPTGDSFADATLLAVLADMCSAKDQPAEALRMIDKVRAMESEERLRVNDMHSQVAEGTIALFDGRMREATARFRTAVAANPATPAGHASGNAWAGVFHAFTVYEGNDLEQASALLRVYLPLAREVGMPDHVILGYRMLVRMAYFAGEVDQAFQLLSELESIGHERRLPRVVASARLERSRTQLHQGHVVPARDELVRASVPELWAPFSSMRLPANDIEEPVLAMLRWEAIAGDAAGASVGLERELQIATKARRGHRALKLRLLSAAAAHRSGARVQALDLMDGALREMREEGFARLVLDEGTALGVLVRDAFERQRPQPSEGDGPYLVWLQRLLQAFGPLPAATPAAPARPVDAYLADPLTPKELRVLQLLAEGYSNKAMADKLLVTVTTVKTHLREINSKLGVGSRLQAVAAGRAFGLLR
jgi:LuxR family transcriptional regulator, maltose regulon positive regulatory protein